MKSIALIEIISIVSYIYSLLMFFIYPGPIKSPILIFLWTVLVCLVFAINHRKSRVYELLILLLLVPLIIFRGSIDLYFILITSIIFYLYMKKFLLQGSYHQYSSQIKKTYLSYIGTGYLRLAIIEAPGSLQYATPFIIIYLLTSILLIRSIRHMESGLEARRIRKANIIYVTGMGIALAIGGLDRVREYLKIVGDKIISLVAELIYLPVRLVIYIIDKIMRYFRIEDLEGDLVPGPLEEMGTKELGGESMGSFIRKSLGGNYEILRLVAIIIISLTLVYILYKIVQKTGNRVYEGAEYLEEREHIERRKKRRRFFSRERYPKDLKGQIRYYYRRYLEKLEKAKVDLVKSDTSYEINEKARENLEGEIEEIRNIYIRTRYGEKKVDKDLVEKIKGLYRDL